MPENSPPAALSGAASVSGGNRSPLPGSNLSITNRLRPILLHIPWYSIKGYARLAEDVGVDRSTISRLVNGKTNVSYRLAESVARAISFRNGFPIEMREVFSTDGMYPTPRVCDLMDCIGCFPPEAWDQRTDSLKPEWEDQIPGDWCRYPNESPAAGSPSSPNS